MALATSNHGETLDALLWRVLGTTMPIDAVYAANPGLAAFGPVLPDATEVLLPDAVAAPAALRETVTLWS